MALCTEMLLLGRLARTPAAARRMLTAALDSGEAAERFQRMVSALGGPKRFVADPWKHLERAPIVQAIHPVRPGVVASVNTRAVGMAVVAIGGGRTRPQDTIDHAVGLTDLAGIGDAVGADRPLAVVHARTQSQVAVAREAVLGAYRVGRRHPALTEPIAERITG